MKIKIMGLIAVFFILTTMPIILAESNQVFFSIILDYDSGTIIQNDIKLIEAVGEIDKKSTIGDYKLKMYSSEKELLYETNFDFDLEIFNSPPEEWFDDEGNQIYIPDKSEIESTIEKTTKVLFAPYFPHANEIVIEKGGEAKLIIDVSKFCVEDCSGTDTTKIADDKNSSWKGIIIAGSIIAFLVILLLITKICLPKKYNKIKSYFSKK